MLEVADWGSDWTLIWIWSLVFATPIIRILALYLDSEGAKNIHVLLVLIWGFGGHWGFLTGTFHLDIDFDNAENINVPQVLI